MITPNGSVLSASTDLIHVPFMKKFARPYEYEMLSSKARSIVVREFSPFAVHTLSHYLIRSIHLQTIRYCRLAACENFFAIGGRPLDHQIEVRELSLLWWFRLCETRGLAICRYTPRAVTRGELAFGKQADGSCISALAESLSLGGKSNRIN